MYICIMKGKYVNKAQSIFCCPIQVCTFFLLLLVFYHKLYAIFMPQIKLKYVVCLKD